MKKIIFMFIVCLCLVNCSGSDEAITQVAVNPVSKYVGQWRLVTYGGSSTTIYNAKRLKFSDDGSVIYTDVCFNNYGSFYSCDGTCKVKEDVVNQLTFYDHSLGQPWKVFKYKVLEINNSNLKIQRVAEAVNSSFVADIPVSAQKLEVYAKM